MLLNEFLRPYAANRQTRQLASLLRKKTIRKATVGGLTQSAMALHFAAVADRVGHPLLFIMRDADDAGYLYQDFVNLLGADKALLFPSSYKRAIKFGQRDAASEIMRTEVLTALAAHGSGDAPATDTNASHADTPVPTVDNANAPTTNANASHADTPAPIVITYPAAIAELVISRQNLSQTCIALHKGQRIDITEVQRLLLEMGFSERDYVYEPGQFAVRGSILDVYSFSNEQPFRIDFFDDEIDTMRTFNVESQLSIDMLQSLNIVPEIARTHTDKIPFPDVLPDDCIVLTHDMRYILDAIDYIYKDGFSQQAVLDRTNATTEAEKAEVMRELSVSLNLCPATRMEDSLGRFRQVVIGRDGSHAEGVASISPEASSTSTPATQCTALTFHTHPQPLMHKNFELLAQTMADLMQRGYRIYILSDSEKQHDRLKEILQNTRTEADNAPLKWTAVRGVVHEGFVDDTLRMAVFTDHQIFERFHKYQLKAQNAKRGKMALTMKELQEMEPGDFIVHVDFGIGKFAGLVRVPTQTKNADGQLVNGYQEVIRIVYQKNDMVDVSIHSLYKISKYRRADSDEPPRLSTLGTGAWERIKDRAKKRIKDIARDLIRLYAKRRHEKGYAFSPDNYMQHELEGSFLYEDTPDQAKATAEVKRDMEAPRPMDRLVCGDVGFGKTEVAIRAAFKAACDSKQVAVLVPTTVLAFQHYKTFIKRLGDLPVRVDYLSRARTPKQTKDILASLAEGKIDILVGTHRMLTKSVKWHDLGLLIIDEEQKFGVSTKEKLRQAKTNVDTLTMSATPIPRTLQFSLMGARDMSIIRTPPPNRQPIDTQVTTFSTELITEAINFEMSRDGQIYFICNRIATLDKMKNIIEKYVPDCRIAIGHGQMRPEDLEKTIMGFINHDYDLLLSTTIVENGIDVPNANTIIISDANHFGLSDLHQMRGRVGRSNRKAFCYIIAPPLSALSNESRRRLEALETFADLGSGFSLAMQDLDIRGAGNLLGAEQSGFMEDLGYETYQKILSQAVNELKNDEFQDLYQEQLNEGEQLTGDDFVDDCNIDSDLQMYFPDTYVPGSSERMLLYRELDKIETDDDLAAYRQRMEDRFGPMPPEGEELLQVVLLRRLGRRLGCERLILKQHQMQMQFVSNEQSVFYQSRHFTSILNYVSSHAKHCTFRVVGGHNRLVIKDVPSVSEAVRKLKKMMPGDQSKA